jgi:hypothetical protein
MEVKATRLARARSGQWAAMPNTSSSHRSRRRSEAGVRPPIWMLPLLLIIILGALFLGLGSLASTPENDDQSSATPPALASTGYAAPARTVL